MAPTLIAASRAATTAITGTSRGAATAIATHGAVAAGAASGICSKEDGAGPSATGAASRKAASIGYGTAAVRSARRRRPGSATGCPTGFPDASTAAIDAMAGSLVSRSFDSNVVAYLENVLQRRAILCNGRCRNDPDFRAAQATPSQGMRADESRTARTGRARTTRCWTPAPPASTACKPLAKPTPGVRFTGAGTSL